MLNDTVQFRVEDAVSVDTSEYDLAPPGVNSRSPGIVLAITEDPQPRYHVRVRLRLGGTIDLTVPAEKISQRAPFDRLRASGSKKSI